MEHARIILYGLAGTHKSDHAGGIAGALESVEYDYATWELGG